MSYLFSLIFAALVLLYAALSVWLGVRQQRHIAQHRAAVPPAFAEKISLAAHQKAADYNLAQLRLGQWEAAFSLLLLMAWTLLGGLNWLNGALLHWLAPGLWQQLALLLAFVLIGSVLDLPFSLWRTFVLEEKFGFNKSTWRLWLGDALKGAAVSALIGLPLATALLWFMGQAGPLWWLYAWGLLVALQFVLLLVYPLWIAPLFNDFQPLEDEGLKARALALMQQAGLQAQGFFVMDGSRRSTHSNAYFTGVGRSKRVVFYDTLLAKLNAGQVDAVLAHELGHFKHQHIRKRLIMLLVLSLGAFALLGWLSAQVWFYDGLGLQPFAGPHAMQNNAGAALILFMLLLPVLGFFFTPIMSHFSRKDEFEADRYACTVAQGQDLGQALLTLYEENASTLTPDPWFVRFYYSHPPAAQRLAAMGFQVA